MADEKYHNKLLAATVAARSLEYHYDILSEDDRRTAISQACWAVRELMAVRNVIRDLANLEASASETCLAFAEQSGMGGEHAEAERAMLMEALERNITNFKGPRADLDFARAAIAKAKGEQP